MCGAFEINRLKILNETDKRFKVLNRDNGDYNQFHNILRLFDVLPNFLSPQVKRWAIITYKHGIYELPHKLSNDLRLRILGN